MTIDVDFSQSYPTAEAERGKFAKADTTNDVFADYPVDGRGKFVLLTYEVGSDAVDFTQSYPTAEAERGKFVKIDDSTITDYPSAGRGKYALLTYNVNAGSSQSTVTPISSVTVGLSGGLDLTPSLGDNIIWYVTEDTSLSATGWTTGNLGQLTLSVSGWTDFTVEYPETLIENPASIDNVMLIEFFSLPFDEILRGTIVYSASA